MSDKEIEELKARIEQLEKESAHDKEGNLEEIKETLKEIERKPGCLKQFAIGFLLLCGVIVFIAVVAAFLDESEKRKNVKNGSFTACLKKYENHPMKEQAREVCMEEVYGEK